jgi:hypothetical protein
MKLCTVASLAKKPGDLEKSGKQKMIREKLGINKTVRKRSGSLFDQGKLPLQHGA